jgi:hypothetical protein
VQAALEAFTRFSSRMWRQPCADVSCAVVRSPGSRTATGLAAFLNALSPSNSQIPRFQKS